MMTKKNMLAPHPSALLEYWFFKVNSGSVALLVDWIAKRHANEHWLRVSIYSPFNREVLFEKQIDFMTDGNFLNTQHTAGRLGNVEWELNIESVSDWIKPDIFPAGILRMTDLALVSAPQANFTGWIRHGGKQFAIQNATGIISHYWGRQLASEWWWISANQFDQAEIAVECSIFRSSLWGSSMKIPLAYLFLHQKGKKELVMAPFGLSNLKGSVENFEIEIKRIGAESITLIGVGRDYGDLGDGIVNTLVGDLDIRIGKKLIARAKGSVGIEHRALKN